MNSRFIVQRREREDSPAAGRREAGCPSREPLAEVAGGDSTGRGSRHVDFDGRLLPSSPCSGRCWGQPPFSPSS